nr:MAG: hypothetical protein [Podoviridae sp. ctka020]
MARPAGGIPGARKVNFARGPRGAQMVRNFFQARRDVRAGYVPSRDADANSSQYTIAKLSA